MDCFLYDNGLRLERVKIKVTAEKLRAQSISFLAARNASTVPNMCALEKLLP